MYKIKFDTFRPKSANKITKTYINEVKPLVPQVGLFSIFIRSQFLKSKTKRSEIKNVCDRNFLSKIMQESQWLGHSADNH